MISLVNNNDDYKKKAQCLRKKYKETLRERAMWGSRCACRFVLINDVNENTFSNDFPTLSASLWAAHGSVILKARMSQMWLRCKAVTVRSGVLSLRLHPAWRVMDVSLRTVSCAGQEVSAQISALFRFCHLHPGLLCAEVWSPHSSRAHSFLRGQYPHDSGVTLIWAIRSWTRRLIPMLLSLRAAIHTHTHTNTHTHN